MAIHHHRKELNKRTKVRFTDAGERLTEQHHEKACDIEHILRQYARSGVITHITNIPGRYENLPDQLDYQQALELVSKGNEAFASLSSSVRERYSNNPRQFLNALTDPSQREFLTSAGVFNTRQSTVLPDGSSHVSDVPAA